MKAPLHRSIAFPLHALGAALAMALVGLQPTAAQAGGTRTWHLKDFDDFDSGEAEGAAVESAGRVSVGFVADRVDIPGTTAFSCVGLKDSIWVGTSDKAAIHRVVSKRKGPPKVEPVAELDGVAVTAMAELPGGDVVAATLPGGTLVRVSARGKVSKFATLPVEQIWALMVADGKLWAGTGPKGELFSMSLSGADPKVVLDVSEKHVLSLAKVGKQVVAGTSPGAKLYATSDKPEGVLLHDFPGDEVRAIALTRTGLLAAVNEFDDRKLTSVDALTKTLNRTSLVGQPASGAVSTPTPPKADAKVFHVDLGKGRDLNRATESPWEQWLSRDRQYFTSLLALDDVGTVLVGSSADGKVYRLRGPRTVSTVADFEERQTTGLCRSDKGSIYATTSGTASAYSLLATAAKKARYRTKVFSATQPAAYGALAIHGKSLVSARARVGPSDKPDARWTEWKNVTVARSGGAFRGTLAGLPHRRYMQLELALERPDSEVRSVEVFYAPENLAPLLRTIELERPKFASGDKSEPSSNVTIKWKADARDEDDLIYDIRVRPEGGGETDWVNLHPAAERVTKRELKWDLTTVPDGVYEVEVTASDEPSNGASAALEDEIRSEPFVVDRERPQVSDVKISGRNGTANARDNATHVHDVAFSIDGADFVPTAAADGLFDSPAESVVFELPEGVTPGRHRLVVRARDAFGNIGTQAVFFNL